MTKRGEQTTGFPLKHSPEIKVSAENIWTAAQQQLRSMLSPDIYKLWFAPLRPGGIDGGNFVVMVNDEFCRVWLTENYASLLRDIVVLVTGQELGVKFIVAPEHGNGHATHAPESHARTHAAPEHKPRAAHAHVERDSHAPAPAGEVVFNPKSTFETFVVGRSNELAAAAARVR